MKLFYFLIVIAIIYFIATQIKVVHVDTLPNEHKTEVNNRSKIRSMLISNHLKDNKKSKNNSEPETKSVPVKKPSFTMEDDRLVGYTDEFSSEQFNSQNYKHDYYDLSGNPRVFPNISNLVFLIKSEYADVDYRFNVPNQPVTMRYPNRNTSEQDAKYIKYIRRDIEQWNDLFKKYYQTDKKLIKINGIRLLFIRETTNDFVLTSNVSLSYLGKTLHCELTYYGQIERNDDFLNGATDMYTLQLVTIKPISKSEFNIQVEPNDEGPFMSMREQLDYVDRMNRIHQNENDGYE
jgi:hypothetical protein